MFYYFYVCSCWLFTFSAEVTNSYRLRGQKKPLYAQPPGISIGSSTSAVPSTNLFTTGTTSTSGGVMEAAAAATVQYQSAATQPEVLSYINQVHIT